MQRQRAGQFPLFPLALQKTGSHFIVDTGPRKHLRYGDKMIPPAAQRAMAARAGSTVREVVASHSLYVSQPQAVASIIEEAAKGAE